MAKVILLGGSGFVGKALATLLAAVKVTYVAPGSKSLDLADESAVAALASMVEAGDTVMMLSAYTPEKGAASELTLKNIRMMQHVLQAVEGKDIAQFIYVSSDAVYPMSADVIDERTPPCPYDLYGQMHLLREQYARSAIPAEKLTILRPCAIYGVGDTHNSYGINRFIRNALAQGEIALFGGGEEYRDHVAVGDVAQIIFAAYAQRQAGLFNIATGKAERFATIAAMIQDAVKKPVKVTYKNRAVPITHRHFNTVKLLRTFPDCAPRRIASGISEMTAAMAEAA